MASVPGPLLNSPYHKYKTFEKKSDAILFCAGDGLQYSKDGNVWIQENSELIDLTEFLK